MKPHSRRTFIVAAAALTGASIIPGVAEVKQSSSAKSWDLAWLDNLKGKHKQVFDLEDVQRLRTVANWLDAYEETFQLSHPDINAVVGIASKGFPINASDDLYRKLPIGEHWKIDDPETQKPAMRNIFLAGGKTPADERKTVRALQARGVIFWQCNKSLLRLSKELGEKLKRPEAEVYEDMRSGLNPGVIVVPAHTMVLGLAQEHGCTYEAL